MRTITVPSGIGDNIWLLMKLINANEKFHFKLPDSAPQRGKQIFDLLPQVSASCEYAHVNYRKILKLNIQDWKRYWHDIDEDDFMLSMNHHLECGRRIENFFPDLDVSFRIDWQIPTEDMKAKYIWGSGKYIGLYGSSYSTSRSWGFWDENKWMDLVELCGRDYTYVVIGAEWDLDLGRNLVELLKHRGYRFVNTIGENLATVIEIMKRLHYFFSFPSGLGILATTVGCPVTMFYPEHLSRMLNAWASPWDISSTLYKGCMFCSPQEIFNWCKENGKV